MGSKVEVEGHILSSTNKIESMCRLGDEEPLGGNDWMKRSSSLAEYEEQLTHEKEKFRKLSLQSENVSSEVKQTMCKLGQDEDTQQFVRCDLDHSDFPLARCYSEEQRESYPLVGQDDWMKEFLNLSECAQCLEAELRDQQVHLKCVEGRRDLLVAETDYLEMQFVFLRNMISEENIRLSGRVDSLRRVLLDVSGRFEEKIQVFSCEFCDLIEWMKSGIKQLKKDNAFLTQKLEDQENRSCYPYYNGSL